MTARSTEQRLARAFGRGLLMGLGAPAFIFIAMADRPPPSPERGFSAAWAAVGHAMRTVTGRKAREIAR